MKKPNYVVTLILAGVILYFAVQAHFGFVLAFLVPVLLVYYIVGVIQLIRRPAERRQRAVRMTVWLAVIAVSGCMQGYWAHAARAAADAVAKAVLAFKSSAGTYPQTLADVHIDEAQLADRWMLRYRLSEGKPQLSYASTYLPLDGYEFDFDNGKWVLNSY